MLDVFYGVLAALIVKEIIMEIVVYLETYIVRLKARKAI